MFMFSANPNGDAVANNVGSPERLQGLDAWPNAPLVHDQHRNHDQHADGGGQPRASQQRAPETHVGCLEKIQHMAALSPPRTALAGWAVFAGYWAWGTLQVAESARGRSGVTLEHVAGLCAFIGGLVLVFAPLPATLPVLHVRIVPERATFISWAGAALSVLGIGLAIWARSALDRNWDMLVDLKLGHQLVTHGVYALVRHPIYAGVTLAQIGTGMSVGTVRGFIPLLGLGALCRKALLEELLLADTFGDEYAEYANAVPYRIAPGVW